MENTEKPNPSQQIATMLRRIINAEGEAMGCEDCFDLLGRCADLVEAGQPFGEIYPQIKKHLDNCACCLQEFEALLVALGALQPPSREPASG